MLKLVVEVYYISMKVEIVFIDYIHLDYQKVVASVEVQGNLINEVETVYDLKVG